VNTEGGKGLFATIVCSKPVTLDIQLTCNAGELVAITGPSGSGKSTVLRALAGIHPIQAGIIECSGKTWFKRAANASVQLSPQQRNIGMVFQHYALFPHLNALQNVMLTASGDNRAKRKAQAMDWLARTNLAGLEHRRPAALSGGQKQRLALARALARNPCALLLDEPFSAVDQQTRKRLYQELSNLRQNLDIPMFLVTHDLSEVQQLADGVCLMHQGRVVQAGSVQEVFAQPTSSLAARLVGQSNLFRGTVSDTNRISCQLGTIVCNTNQFARGEKVVLVVPQSAVVLHRQDRPSRGERENPVTAKLATSVQLGDNVTLTLHLPNSAPDTQATTSNTPGQKQETLQFQLSAHVAKRNGVALGQSLTVSLIADALHVMAN